MMGLVFITANKSKFTHTLCGFDCITPIELKNGDWWIDDAKYQENKALIDANATIDTDYTYRDVDPSEFKIV